MVHKRWLEWRLEILTPLKEGHERDRAELLEDRARLDTLSAAFDRELNLVELRAKHASLRLQLAQEKRKVEEVQACDQEELAHRRSDIKEQKSVALVASIAAEDSGLTSLFGVSISGTKSTTSSLSCMTRASSSRACRPKKRASLRRRRRTSRRSNSVSMRRPVRSPLSGWLSLKVRLPSRPTCPCQVRSADSTSSHSRRRGSDNRILALGPADRPLGNARRARYPRRAQTRARLQRIDAVASRSVDRARRLDED